MKTIITEAQKLEIEELAVNHSDALIAFGGVMYRSGWIKGCIATGAAAIVGTLIGKGICIIIDHYKENLEKEELS